MPKRDPAHMSAQRERIIRATMECIAERGVEGSSIQHICRQAGLSVGAVYVHFRNKEEIVEAVLHYGSVKPEDLPDTWSAFKAMVVSFEPQMGFDIATVIRNRLHLHAECVRPGSLHDSFKPIVEHSMKVLAGAIQKMADNGSVRLKMSAYETALSISAFIDGMLWTALATDRPLEEFRPLLAAGLDVFVSPVAGKQA
ncbi:TetR family transcriptional regulator [Sphingomonas sp. MAH-20]|uniref:TetR family transcriptional regulator n=1 Tax=Sphingomonas horti TaxID=2682842 RepID=A0A6I4J5X3_9SPHN|nr:MULTISPECIES: TetR/AcrR family transcriptional regulator [Sphingomonas]MBA2921005.1 TetR/AcrR family transcriptional regulator [Sphingomonas sp. CGMCC 1.13658]MVO79518.1 TetR family transcriptional regulator [Sphingomonas horti]